MLHSNDRLRPREHDAKGQVPTLFSKLNDKSKRNTGGSRAARCHTFVRQKKYAKEPSQVWFINIGTYVLDSYRRAPLILVLIVFLFFGNNRQPSSLPEQRKICYIT